MRLQGAIVYTVPAITIPSRATGLTEKIATDFTAIPSLSLRNCHGRGCTPIGGPSARSRQTWQPREGNVHGMRHVAEQHRAARWRLALSSWHWRLQRSDLTRTSSEPARTACEVCGPAAAGAPPSPDLRQAPPHWQRRGGGARPGSE